MEAEEIMKEFVKCTFGGLKTSYLVRQYIFGALIAAVFFSAATKNGQDLSIATIAVFTVNTLLYPYSRFVYERIVEFVMGNNVFFVNAVLMLTVKAFTMVLCWAAAIFVAPLGLAYIYYHQLKTQS
ncbi:hypothetical protein HJ171_10055 [Vibrio parahaemolyticus]|uniref:hypothetical protein n=2 Tax=Vibrio TaxID=662 RepID=UPI0009A5CADD|nr:hypothetical protein [Vibrio parahaemolyticus]EJG0872286.1 hypothetical protein [Vibrio parahaemolyticus O3]EJG0900945.1 hypothetical protein [Vibrio parahaemolyticus O3:K56]EJG1073039.1 hypothetical protein [Vibrio parahaemolyticus O1:K56]HBK5924126.1 hypothetical protein [Vibrio alginolyticus]EGQ7766881.1 hypothetical protein [Vibrio parahaemolyticus]